MFSKERQSEILTYLNKHERATVNNLAKLFHVSKETIRNDLNYLAQCGSIQRCHGGAIVLRRIFQSQSVNKLDSDIILFFDSNAPKRTTYLRHKGKKMKGKVCILGSFNVDLTAIVERFPRSGESILSSNTIIGPGGKGSNQALAASKCLVDTHFVAKVGSDEFSRMAWDHLSASDITSFTLYQDKECKTGSALIYVSQVNGENMIAICPGANHNITAEEVDAIAPELANSTIFLTQLENNVVATARAVEIAHRAGVKVILNPAPYSEDVLQCLPFVDVITPNETEASMLSGISVTDIDSAKAAAKAIQEKGVGCVIITMGSKGALIYDTPRFIHIPALKALCIDTTGAGDAFNGALAAAMANGQPLVQAAKFASAFASLTVEREGASNMPEYENVLSRLAQFDALPTMKEID